MDTSKLDQSILDDMQRDWEIAQQERLVDLERMRQVDIYFKGHSDIPEQKTKSTSNQEAKPTTPA